MKKSRVGQVRHASWSAVIAGIVALVLPGVASAADAPAGVSIQFPQTATTSTKVPLVVTGPNVGLQTAQVAWGDGATGVAVGEGCSLVKPCTSAQATHQYPIAGAFTVVVTFRDGSSLSSRIQVTGPTVDVPHRVTTPVAITGLGPVTTTKTSFTVSADGPVPVCDMEFDGQTHTGPGPHTFIYDPAVFPRQFSQGTGTVTVHFCDKGYTSAPLATTVPFTATGSNVIPVLGDATEDRQATWTVTNTTGNPASVVLLRGNAPLVSQPLPAHSEAKVLYTFPTTLPAGSTRYTLRVRDDSGSPVLDFPIVAANGWSPIGFYPGSVADPTFAPCSTVTWFYDTQGQPQGASKLRATAVQTLALLGRTSGLRFVQVADAGQAQLTIDWTAPKGGWTRGVDGQVAGLGGPGEDPGTGRVHLNPATRWVQNRYAGLGGSTRGTPGNGWLVAHEVMHAMGLGHSVESYHYSSRTGLSRVPGFDEVMAPRGTFSKLGTGDLAGIDFLYQPKTCPPAP